MLMSVEGVAVALLAAMSWAVALTINKFLTKSVGSVSMNTVRLWSGFVMIIAFVFFFGKYESTYLYPTFPLFLVVASGVVALAVGDTIFIKSLSLIYVSQAFPVGQCTFLALTVVTAILFLSEAFTLLNIVGGGLILGGLYLVAGFGYQSRIPALKSGNLKGLLLAFLAALAWTIGAVILKLGLIEMNAIFAAGIRTFSAAAALTVFTYCFNSPNNPSFMKTTNMKKRFLAGFSGMLGYGIGGIAYVAAMQRVGAGRTVLITSLTPVFVLILSVLFLKEKPTPQSLIGTIICIVGVMFLSV
jgi:transporter family protein